MLTQTQILVKKAVEKREKALIKEIFKTLKAFRKYRPKVSPPGKPFVVFLKDIKALEKYYLK